MLKKIVLSALLLGTSSVSQANILINCNDSDTAAVLEMPSPMNKILKVDCTLFGHVVTTNVGVSMVYAKNMQPFFIPAQLSKTPKQRGNANFFKSISHHELTSQEIREKYALIKEQFKETDYPKIGVELITVNNLDLEQRAYIFSNKTGYHCAPDCTISRMFVVLNPSDVKQTSNQSTSKALGTPIFQNKGSQR